jgi:hypothetical protein
MDLRIFSLCSLGPISLNAWMRCPILTLGPTLLGPAYGEGCLRTNQKFPRFIHLMGMHLMGVHLMGVHLMGVHLMGVRLMSMHLMGGTYFDGVLP